MGQQNKYSKSTILEYVEKQMSVAEIAEAMNVDVNEFIECYAQYSRDDRKSFPLKLLLTKEWLEQELQTSKVADICRRTKTSPSVIKAYCEKYGFQSKLMLKYILTKEVLYELFVKQRMTDGQIASMYACSLESVKKLRNKYGIEAGARTDAEGIITIELFHRLFVEYGFTIQQLAEMLGCTHYVVRSIQQQFEIGDGRLNQEIRNRKKYYAFQGLIEILLEKYSPQQLFEELKTQTLAEVAEGCSVIPSPVQGVETFSVDWFKIVLRSMPPMDIVRTYHLGKAFVQDTIHKYKLGDICPANYMDENLVRKLYCENGWTDEEIAHLMHVPVYLVVCFRKKQGIKRSKQYTIAQRLSADEFVNLYIKEDLTIAQIAELYEVSAKSVSTLKATYAKNYSAIATHKSHGAIEERVAFLKKKLKFRGFNEK